MERSIYDILSYVDTILTASALVESVSFGDIDEVALKKTTIYPLAHVTLNPSSFNGKVTTLSLSIICMDIVAQNKTEGTIYEKNNNEIDVLNSMHALCGYILEKFRVTEIGSGLYKWSGSATAEPFTERFEDDVAGWVLTLSVNVPNNIQVC